MYTHILSHTRILASTHTCTHTFSLIYACSHTHSLSHTHTHTPTHIHTQMGSCTHKYMTHNLQPQPAKLSKSGSWQRKAAAQNGMGVGGGGGGGRGRADMASLSIVLEREIIHPYSAPTSQNMAVSVQTLLKGNDRLTPTGHRSWCPTAHPVRGSCARTWLRRENTKTSAHSVQFRMVPMHLGKSVCALPCLMGSRQKKHMECPNSVVFRHCSLTNMLIRV